MVQSGEAGEHGTVGGIFRSHDARPGKSPTSTRVLFAHAMRTVFLFQSLSQMFTIHRDRIRPLLENNAWAKSTPLVKRTRPVQSAGTKTPFSPIARSRIHRRSGKPWTKDRDACPMRKGTYAVAKPPQHRQIMAPSTACAWLRVDCARMIETHHECAFSQQAAPIDLVHFSMICCVYLDKRLVTDQTPLLRARRT